MWNAFKITLGIMLAILLVNLVLFGISALIVYPTIQEVHSELN